MPHFLDCSHTLQFLCISCFVPPVTDQYSSTHVILVNHPFVQNFNISYFTIYTNHSLFASIEFTPDYVQVFYHFLIKRLLSYNLTFSTLSELLIGLILVVPLFRRFEREMGTRLFIFFIIKTLILSKVLQRIVLDYFLDIKINYSIGPYPQLGAMLYMFQNFTPPFYILSISNELSLNISGKHFICLFILWFASYKGMSSSIPTFCGFLSGSFSLKPEFPDKIYSKTKEFLTYLGLMNSKCHNSPFNSSSLISMAQTYIPTRTNSTNCYDDQGTNFIDTSAGRPILNDKLITITRRSDCTPQPLDKDLDEYEQLINMGFKKENVLKAIENCLNNVEVKRMSCLRTSLVP